MIFFKSCPKCRGDMYLTADTYGPYQMCLQCGYLLDMVDGFQQRIPVPVLVEQEAA